MKKINYIVLLILGGILMTNCQKDNVSEQKDNVSQEESNKIISVKVKKVPTKITVIYPDEEVKYDIFFTYDAEGRLKEINDRYFTKGYNIITNFDYNEKDQIIKATERDIRTGNGDSYVASTIIREYSYDNGFLATITSEYRNNKEEFKYNKDKQLIKVTYYYSDHYNEERSYEENFTYDDKGNVKWKEKKYDNKRNMIGEIETIYDDKNNPFRYLNIPYGTNLSANLSSYEIKQLSFINNALSIGWRYMCEYIYDKDNYPIEIIEKYTESGEVSRILTYKYKTLP